MISEKKRAENKAYYQTHREEISERKRAYYQAHRKEILKKQKAYYAANPTIRKKHNEYMRKYRQIRGICRILEKHRQALADDPERLSTDFILKLVQGNDL